MKHKFFRFVLGRQPVLVGQFVGAVISLLVVFGAPIDAETKTAIVGLIQIGFALISTSATASAATVAVVAEKAATQTAERLNRNTAGNTGGITSVGKTIVRDVVGGVLGELGGAVKRFAPANPVIGPPATTPVKVAEVSVEDVPSPLVGSDVVDTPAPQQPEWQPVIAPKPNLVGSVLRRVPIIGRRFR